MNHIIFTYPNLLKLQIESFSLEELISDYENIYNTTTSKKNLINNYTPMTVTATLYVSIFMSSIDIFLESMANIVYIEKRPFSYRDFLFFEYEGKDYRFEHGTIRNIFSKLRKGGKIELAYRSTPSFHTLTGIKFKKPITLNHGEDYSLLQNKRAFFNYCRHYRWINQLFTIYD